MAELTKGYQPGEVEESWYARWLDAGCFTADPESSKPAYSIVIPPPNITGILHMGHVLNATIQDILARRARMLGYEVLWLPGTDHAGISTQNVVEKTLRKEGVMRHRDDLGREALVAKIHEWREKYGGIIIQQLKRLGASCDWTRERFTLDPDYVRCVQQVFVDLYNKGLIYRGRRMVNWCPVSLTALSDEEVEMRPQNGYLYTFRVEVDGEPGTFLEIATTRPETIPADTAVAVNPNDGRFRHLIGRNVRRALPLENQALLPIIADEAIDPEFGTGVLKVTPAHDRTDFEIGQRHGLPEIDVLNPDGTLNDLAGRDLAGLDRFEARKKAVEILREAGALVKEEPYQNNVGFSERAGVPIEPRLSEQWFLRYPSVEASREVVSSGRMRFHPERWTKVYDHWMGNLQDWCISRQLWWGHRIPVWYRDGEVRCQIDSPGDGWEQDPDVLDTWFSSWLWPFATMGWPEKTPLLRRFYPTTDLVTAPDIIFFWVARMIMAGFEYTGELPFRNVYFTGLIRDKQGRKMSKSLGNSPDPLDLIAKYGADALRFGIMRSAPLGADLKFDEAQIEEGRNFANKLWNAVRFRLMQGAATPGAPKAWSIYQIDILARLDRLQKDLEAVYAAYTFNQAAHLLYDFFWGHYCDLFLEAVKGDLQPGADPARREAALATMDAVLRRFLQLLHPFMPHVTEELWHTMEFGGPDSFLMLAPLETASVVPAECDATAVEQAQARAAAVYASAARIRFLKASCGLASNRTATFLLKPSHDWVGPETGTLRLLAQAGAIEVRPDFQPSRGIAVIVTDCGEVFLPLEGLVDAAAEAARLRREVGKIESEIAKVEARLSSDGFLARATQEVIDEHHRRKADLSAKKVQIADLLQHLEG